MANPASIIAAIATIAIAPDGVASDTVDATFSTTSAVPLSPEGASTLTQNERQLGAILPIALKIMHGSPLRFETRTVTIVVQMLQRELQHEGPPR
jgi:hypothetical protein